MNINWFRNPGHLAYVNAETELPELEKRLALPGLTATALAFMAAPNAEGVQIKGARRSTARLFIPDLTFGEHIEMGENAFLYLGEISDCYVIFKPMKKSE